jgi:arabinose-5-phosphate isomerase
MTDLAADKQDTAASCAADFLRHEAAAITAAADSLDPASFGRAVEMLAACIGNVATTGIGTSGIVARKIAATLTSTGTPTVFVHPSDALHGGLGVIGNQEVVVAISNSGETDEVSALFPYLRARDVAVIAIVGNPASTLAREASVALEASVEHEGDPLDLVPSTSALVALALGDALALAVMERRGITPESFAANHPSGRLGRRLTLRVRDVMRAGDQLPYTRPDQSLLEAVSEISRGGLGAVAILDPARKLVGIVTDGDIRRTLERCDVAKLTSLRAGDVMTPEPVVISGKALAYDALRLMEDRPSQISVLPVVDGPCCVGLVRLHDLVQLGL